MRLFRPVINLENRGQQNCDGWFCSVLFFALDLGLISVHIVDMQGSILSYMVCELFWYAFFPDFKVDAYFLFIILAFYPSPLIDSCWLKPPKPWWNLWSFSIREGVSFCLFSNIYNTFLWCSPVACGSCCWEVRPLPLGPCIWTWRKNGRCFPTSCMDSSYFF